MKKTPCHCLHGAQVNIYGFTLICFFYLTLKISRSSQVSNPCYWLSFVIMSSTISNMTCWFLNLDVHCLHYVLMCLNSRLWALGIFIFWRPHLLYLLQKSFIIKLLSCDDTNIVIFYHLKARVWRTWWLILVMLKCIAIMAPCKFPTISSSS
jgi:hypothetical protein